MFKTGTQISGYPEIWSQEGLKSETKINFKDPLMRMKIRFEIHLSSD